MSKKEQQNERFDHEDLLDLQSVAPVKMEGPLVDDSDDDFDEDDSEGFSGGNLVRLLLSPIQKIASFSWLALRFPLRGIVCLGALFGKAGRAVVGVLGRAGSMFVLRGAEDEEELIDEESAPKKRPDAVESALATKPDHKPIASAAATEEMFEDDDEEVRFFNLGFGMKMAGLAAVCLLGVGGYFGVKSFLSKGDPAPAQAVADSSEDADADAEIKDAFDIAAGPAPAPAKAEEKKAAKAADPKALPPKPEDKKGEKTAAAKPAPPKKPEDKKDEKTVAAKPAPPKKPEDKKDEKTVAAKPAPAPAPPKKPEDKKDEKTVADKPAPAPAPPKKPEDKKDEKALAAKPAPTSPKAEDKKDEKPLAAKPAPAPPKVEEKKDVKTVATKPAPAAPNVAEPKTDPFLVGDSVPGAPVPAAPAPLAPESATSPFWATSPSASPAPAAETVNWASPAAPSQPSGSSDPFSAIAPLAASSSTPQEPTSLMPLAGPIDPTPAAAPPLLNNSPAPMEASNAAANPVSGSSPSGALVPLQTLAASPTPPVSPPAPNDIPNERPVGIPESGLARFAAEEFRRVPEAPKVETPVSNLQFDEPIQPLAPTTSMPDTVPGIPSSAAVEPLARTAAPSPMQPIRVAESTPGIPTDSAPAPSVAFSPPSISPTASAPVAAASSSYVPPIPASQPVQPIQPMQPTSPPLSTSSAPVTVAAAPMQPISAGAAPSGERVGIPGDAFQPIAAVAPRPAAPTQPEHVQLAQTDPPLGSRLQNQVQEFRTQENADPKLNFQRKDGATGAVRFSPAASTGNPALLPMPTDDQPGALEALNPTGTVQDPSRVPSLPPASEAPRAMVAESSPGYDRSLRRRAPAEASVDSGTASTGNPQNRARLFQQRLDEEIKRSPNDTELYTVQDGDTYMTICDRFFGTSLLYRALAEHNRRRGAAYMPTAGTQIEIPTADYLKTEYAEVLSRSGRRGNRTSSGTVLQRGGRYRVQEGDSVFRIATDQLRDSSRWRDIVELNSDQLRSAKDLQPGMEIYLPAGNTAVSNTPTVFGRR